VTLHPAAVNDGEAFGEQLVEVLLLGLAGDLHDPPGVPPTQHVQDLGSLCTHLEGGEVKREQRGEELTSRLSRVTSPWSLMSKDRTKSLFSLAVSKLGQSRAKSRRELLRDKGPIETEFSTIPNPWVRPMGSVQVVST
jgi:hypothetical protein